MKKKKNIRVFGNIVTLCLAAFLSAFAVIISALCKSFTVTTPIRITFENLPIILSGYLLGPVAGLLTGLCADVVGTATTYGIGGINPILTVGASSVGFVAGLISKKIIRKESLFQIIVTVFSSHLIGNIIIKTAGLYIYYRTPPIEIIIRMLVYIGIAVVETIVLALMLKAKGINKLIKE